MLGLCCCLGFSLVVVHGGYSLSAGSSLFTEHGFLGMWASVVGSCVACGLPGSRTEAQ